MMATLTAAMSKKTMAVEVPMVVALVTAAVAAAAVAVEVVVAVGTAHQSTKSGGSDHQK